jgi:phenylalanyl-tRNA synthetase beta subunit
MVDGINMVRAIITGAHHEDRLNWSDGAASNFYRAQEVLEQLVQATQLQAADAPSAHDQRQI